MDDIAYGLKYPAVIDFKMGRITYDPEATVEKITRQKLKYVTYILFILILNYVIQ